MPICDCGALTARTHTHLETPDGRPLEKSYTTCPTCRPAEFPAGEVFAPSLDRVVTGPEAMPGKYKLHTDGVLRPTDELMEDTRRMIMADGPTAAAERTKRETRRTAPLSEAELAEAVRWGKEVLGPQLRERRRDEAIREGRQFE